MGAAALDGKLYVVGGCAGSCDMGMAEVDVYDPSTNAWKRMADYPAAVAWLACGAVNGDLVCAGGVDPTTLDSTTAVYAYSPRTNTWTKTTDLPYDVWGAAYSTANGQLLVSGGAVQNGFAITNQGVAFSMTGSDPATGVWSPLPNSNNALYRGGAACGIDKIGGAPEQFDAVPFAEELPGYDQCGAGNVPWLSASPGQATLQPGQSVTVQVTLDASDLGIVDQPGSYVAKLGLQADTPYWVNPITVTMTANPPTTWGKIAGTVSGLKCDGGAAPIMGGTVQIDSWAQSYTLKTGLGRRVRAVARQAQQPADRHRREGRLRAAGPHGADHAGGHRHRERHAQAGRGMLTGNFLRRRAGRVKQRRSPWPADIVCRRAPPPRVASAGGRVCGAAAPRRYSMLTALGASDAEDRIYRYLATTVSVTDDEIRAETRLPVERIREALDALEKRGLVASTDDSPTRYIAASPGAVEAMIANQLRELRSAQGTLDRLSSKYRAEHLAREAATAFEIVRGQEALRQRSMHMVHSARTEVLNMIKPPIIALQSQDRVVPGDGANGRVIFETESLEQPDALAAVQAGLRPNDEIRVHTKLPAKMLITDRSLALVPLTQRDTTPVGVLIHESVMLDGLLALFDYVWAASAPLHVDNINSHAPNGPSPLSGEDRRLLSLLLSGLTDEAIAAHFQVSVRTVQRKVRNLMEAASVRTRINWPGKPPGETGSER